MTREYDIVQQINDLDADLVCLELKVKELQNNIISLKKSINMQDTFRHISNTKTSLWEVKINMLNDININERELSNEFEMINEIVYMDEMPNEFSYDSAKSYISEIGSFRDLSIFHRWLDSNHYLGDGVEQGWLYQDMENHYDLLSNISVIKESILGEETFISTRKLRTKIFIINNKETLDIIQKYILHTLPKIDHQLITVYIEERKRTIDEENELMKLDRPISCEDAIKTSVKEGLF